MQRLEEISPAGLRAGYYRVVWAVDLPKDEFGSPLEAAAAAQELAAERSAVVNVFYVVDGVTLGCTEHDFAS